MKKLLFLLLTFVIIISLASCDWFETKPDTDHEHTWEDVQYETGHFKQYTCGCPSPTIMYGHCDNNGDYVCDECGYLMISLDVDIEWQYSETYHWWCPKGEPAFGIVYEYGEHENWDADLLCDICGYLMEQPITDDTAPKYSLTMNDEEWLYEDLQPTYKAGETVSVKIGIAYDLGYMLFVNGERVMDEADTDGPYWEFIFTMPESDVVIDFRTYDGFLPDRNYGVLIEAYWKKIPKADSVSVIHYYGEYESGAIAAMMTCSEYDYTEALWDEIIDDVVIHYSNGNRIIVLYEGEIYTLTEAYNNGYITIEDLSAISEKHKKFCPYLYE